MMSSNASCPTMAKADTDSYPYSAPDFGGGEDAAASGKATAGDDERGATASQTQALLSSSANAGGDDTLRSVLEGYKPPSTPSDLPPHIPTPPELANRQLGHQSNASLASNSSSRSTSTATNRSKPDLPIPSAAAVDAYKKKGTIDMGYIEKVGSTASMQSQSQSQQGVGLTKSRTDGSLADSNNSNSSSTNVPPSTTSRTSEQQQQQTSSQRGTPGKPQKGESGYTEPQEEEHGAARGEGVSPNDTNQQQLPQPDDEYPEQLHAGKLDGVGPEYGAQNRVTMSDRLQAVKEKVKGTILRKPELKEQGKERMTGELKKKEKEESDNANPFGAAGAKDGDDDEQKEGEEATGTEGQAEEGIASQNNGVSQSNTNLNKTSSSMSSSNALNSPKDTKDTRMDEDANAGLSEAPHAHPTEKGKVEQAASVKPEGTETSGLEQRAHENATTGEVNPNRSSLGGQ